MKYRLFVVFFSLLLCVDANAQNTWQSYTSKGEVEWNYVNDDFIAGETHVSSSQYEFDIFSSQKKVLINLAGDIRKFDIWLEKSGDERLIYVIDPLLSTSPMRELYGYDGVIMLNRIQDFTNLFLVKFSGNGLFITCTAVLSNSM